MARSEGSALPAEGMEAAARWQRLWLETWARTLGAVPQPREAMDAWAHLLGIQRNAWAEAGRLASEAATAGALPDPDEWVDLFISTESQALRGLLWNPAFAAASGAWAVSGASFREAFDDAQVQVLHAWGLPHRRDLEEVGRRLLDVEREGRATRDALKKTRSGAQGA